MCCRIVIRHCQFLLLTRLVFPSSCYSSLKYFDTYLPGTTLIMGFFRRVWPKHNLGDKVAFSFMHIGLTFILFFELFVVLPRYQELYSPMYFLHVAAGLFMAFQVFTNMYRMMLTNTTIKSPDMNLPFVLREGWYYCPMCQMQPSELGKKLGGKKMPPI